MVEKSIPLDKDNNNDVLEIYDFNEDDLIDFCITLCDIQIIPHLFENHLIPLLKISPECVGKFILECIKYVGTCGFNIPDGIINKLLKYDDIETLSDLFPKTFCKKLAKTLRAGGSAK